MPESFLVVDIGTQSLRASLVDQKGETSAFVKRRYVTPYFSPKKGFAEQDADFYLSELCQATKALAKQASFADLKGMVIDDFRDSSVILDDERHPLRPAILWLDQRITPLKGKNFKFWEKLLFLLIGMKDATTYNAERTAAFWLAKNEPELWKKAHYYVPLGAYFNCAITGKLVSSSADCIGHYPINFKTGKWYPTIHPKWDVFGIKPNQLPPLVPVGKVLGTVTKAFSQKSLIPEGLNVYASASDKACETLGNGAIEPDIASVSLGTACTIDVVSEKYKEPEAFLPSYQAPYPGAYDYEVQIYKGLWMVKWFIKEFGYEDVCKAKEQGLATEAYLDSMAEKIPAGSDGLLLEPYWEPGLSRPNARGSIIGFTGHHTRYHLYRAILEGIGYALREGLEEIERKTRIKPSLIVVSGGGSRSQVLVQILADINNIPVMVSSTSESSTLGASISGFLSSGVYASPKEAVRQMVKPGKRVKPNLENARIYEALYQRVYKKTYPSLKKEFLNLKAVLLKYPDEEQ